MYYIISALIGSPRGVEDCLERGYCLREKAERGTDYSNCCATHAEVNSIISSSRDQMIGSTLYLVGKEVKTDEYVKNSEPCSLCKRIIINAGISRVIVRISKLEYKIFIIDNWKNTESITGGY